MWDDDQRRIIAHISAGRLMLCNRTLCIYVTKRSTAGVTDQQISQKAAQRLLSAGGEVGGSGREGHRGNGVTLSMTLKRKPAVCL